MNLFNDKISIYTICILLVVFMCCCKKTIVLKYSNETIVDVDSVSKYIIRLSVEPMESEHDGIFCLILDRDYYYDDKLSVSESRENIYIKDDSCKKNMLELYNAYYIVLSNNPSLDLNMLCIPTTSHGKYYENYNQK